MKLEKLLEGTLDSYFKDICRFCGERLVAIGIDSNNIEVLIGSEEQQDYKSLPIGVIVLGDISYDLSMSNYKRGKELVIASASIVVGIASLGLESILALQDNFIESFGNENSFQSSKDNFIEYRVTSNRLLSLKNKIVNQPTEDYRKRLALKGIAFTIDFSYSMFNKNPKFFVNKEYISFELENILKRENN